MGLEKGKLKKGLSDFIKGVAKMKQEDQDKAIDNYAEMMENLVYDAIRSATVTIPSGAIKTQGSATAQANGAPVVVENGIS